MIKLWIFCNVIPPWQYHKIFRFWSVDRKGSYWFTKDVQYNWPQHFNKKRSLRCTDETVKWYTSYPSHRKFVINIENAYWDKASITFGVLQGSIWVHCSFYFISTTCHRLWIENFYYIPMILICSFNIHI